MSATLTQDRPTATAPAPAPRGGIRGVLALARFEARELLLQIPVFVLFGLYLASTAWQLITSNDGTDLYPVLQDVDRATQSGPSLVGFALLICVNRAALRSHRHGTDGHFDVLPMEPWRRTLAHALSLVPYAAAVAVVVTVQFTWAALRSGAVGHGSYAELAAGPLTILLFGVTGVLLARLVRTTLATVLVVLGAYAALTFALMKASDARWLEWLLPTIDESGNDPLPSDLLGRPAAWHALYLAGLSVLLLCVAVLRSGGRAVAVKAVTGLALAATAAGIAGQSPGDSAELLAARRTATVTPQKVQSCVERSGSTYCAFPEWTERTDDWAKVVADVQRFAGGEAAREHLTVRQRIDATIGLNADVTLTPSTTPGHVTVGTAWGVTRVHEFAAGVASVLVAGDEATGGDVLCDARTVTVTWLALAAEKDPMAALRDVRLDDSVTGSAVVLTPTNPFSLSAAQTDVVRQALQRPRYSVAVAVKAHWAELTSPKTSLARVAEVLGVKAPQGAGNGDSCGEEE
jgi:hypothetical protein